MNHACECGHPPADHYDTTGPCQALDPDKDWPCDCRFYQWQGDE